MSDELALLAAIRDAPDDDLPRLAHADWLEEHGQSPRAEFVRVQIELPPGLGRRPSGATASSPRRVLLIEHGPAWCRRGCRSTTSASAAGTSRRSTATSGRWMRTFTSSKNGRYARSSQLRPQRRGAPWRASAPCWTRWALTHPNRYGTEDDPPLLASPLLRRLRRLKLDGCDEGALAVVYEREDLTQRFESLEVNDLGFDWGGTGDLVARPWPRSAACGSPRTASTRRPSSADGLRPVVAVGRDRPGRRDRRRGESSG